MTRALQRAAQIAALLEGGARWYAALGDSRAAAELRGPGVTLTLVEHDDGHVTVAWSVPPAMREHVPDLVEGRYEINMAGHRSAATMAQEITRRLLPKARESLAAIQTHKVAREAVEADRERVIDQINAALDITPTERDRQGNLQVGQFGGEVYGTVEVSSGDLDVVFTLALHHTLAAAVATAIGNALRA